MAETKGITVTVELRMDDIEAMIEEIKELPTYYVKSCPHSPDREGMTMIDRDGLIEIFQRHLKTEVKR